MKKLVLTLAVCIAAGSMFTRCGDPKPTNEYTVKGTVETNGNPAEAYLSYRLNGEDLMDTAAVVDNKFEFKGITESPFQASIWVNYTPETQLDRRVADRKILYVEPGVITLITQDSVKNATVSGSVVNADNEEWMAQSRVIEQAREEYSTWLRSMTPEQMMDDEVRAQAREKTQAMRDLNENLSKQFIAAHPDSWFALSNLYRSLVNNEDPDGAQELLNSFSERLRATPLGEEKQNQIDGWRTTVIGQVAPDFTQNDPDGNPVKLSDFRGKYVLLDFWASWCGPCRSENPHVVAAYHKYKDRGFTVLGVSLDNPDGRDKWLQAVEDDKLEWAQVSDLKGWQNEVAKLYSVNSIPANWLIDPDGVIVGRGLRGAALEEALEKYLGGE